MAKKGDMNDNLFCSFCGKNQKEVTKLIAGPAVYICDECIQLCSEIIDEESEKATGEVERILTPKEITTMLDDYVIALPQSSEIEFSNGYLWDDLKNGVRDLKGHYTKLVEEYQVSEENVMIGAFSAGAGVAVEALLSEVIPAKRILFIAPWLPNIDSIGERIKKLKNLNVEFYLLCGDADEDCFDCTDEFAEILEKNEIPYEFAIVEGMDHTYPEHFDDMLRHAMSYFERDKEV